MEVETVKGKPNEKRGGSFAKGCQQQQQLQS